MKCLYCKMQNRYSYNLTFELTVRGRQTNGLVTHLLIVNLDIRQC